MYALDFITSQYKKIRLLKQTERSEVWLTADPQEQLFILKRLHQTRLPLLQLKDAQISLLPKLYYITETKDETITIEEYIIGTSLAQYQQDGRFLTPKAATNILLALCDGLAALHALDIIHRDIKPAHILIEKDDTPRLIDFDTCRLLKDNQREDTELLGTKNYAPPEQFGFQQTDCRSDIYALGQTISEMLPSDYQGKLRPILKRCQRLDPADRYQSMQELKAAIQRPALNKRIALLLIPPVLTLLTAYFYPFTSQQPEPTPASTTEETAPTQPENSNTTQETSTTPPAAETIKPSVLATVPNTTTATVPPASLPAPTTPLTSAPTTKATNYIRVQYFWQGRYINEWMENFDTDIDNAGTAIKLPRQCWAAQDNPQGIIHLAPNDTVNIRIRNQSDQPWNNAHAILHYNSNGQTSTKNLPISALSPDETIDLNIPLNQYTITNPKKVTNQTIGQLTIEVKSDAPQKIRCSRYYFNFICLP